MNRKKLTTVLMFAFLPMMGVGLLMHCCGGTTSIEETDPTAKLTGFLFGAGAMLIPLLAVVFTQLIFKEPVLRGLGISFKINRWWWIGWLLMPVVTLAVLGVSLLMPGAQWTTEGEAVEAAMQQMPGLGPWGIIAVTMASGLLSGVTVNAVFAFGEEIAWRGFLVKELKGKKLLSAAMIIGVVWGLWHFPLILNGHNYPDHPVAGVFMMVLMCLVFTPILLYFRQKSGSVVVSAIMHGTFNAVVGVSILFVTPYNDLLVGGVGLAGIVVLLAVDVCLFLYDRFVAKERLFTSEL
ncbi:MAG: CPBP family intramembrane metalloprotease [Bacteroidales bacterium]|nr:CPBP family intramembrane metalloprotease [Bacteroidales bacterium]